MSILDKIFSVEFSQNGKHKIYRILGIKIKKKVKFNFHKGRMIKKMEMKI